MPIKKKTTAAKKPAVLGPKAKLMKLAVTTLRNKAKKLGVSDVQSAQRKIWCSQLSWAKLAKSAAQQLVKRLQQSARCLLEYAKARAKLELVNSSAILTKALAPGRRVSKAGNVYYERRKNRSDKPGQLAGENTMATITGLGKSGSLTITLTGRRQLTPEIYELLTANT
jgi:hypothetical protein